MGEVIALADARVAETWHTLYEGHLSDMPGRCESWRESVRYLGRERWELGVRGLDFSGL